jgi:Predicted amidophosphoribosyltransferases
LNDAPASATSAKGSPSAKPSISFKYHNSSRTAYRLGMLYGRELMADNWQRPIDLLSPVPLHWLKQLQRGYNQSEWIAQGLSHIWNIPVRTDLLKRRRNTTTQTQKNIYERFLNADEAFEARKNTLLNGRHILLVDDVLTSGSTLCACAEALHATADLKISILTLGFAE